MDIITNKKKQKHFYLSIDTQDYIEEYKAKNNISNTSKALERIINEHKNNSKLTTEYMYDSVAEKIASKIENILTDDINKIKRLSRFTDRNTQIILELLNFFLANNGKEADSIITTEDLKVPILERAEKEVDRRLYENFYKKHGSLD